MTFFKRKGSRKDKKIQGKFLYSRMRRKSKKEKATKEKRHTRALRKNLQEAEVVKKTREKEADLLGE